MKNCTIRKNECIAIPFLFVEVGLTPSIIETSEIADRESPENQGGQA